MEKIEIIDFLSIDLNKRGIIESKLDAIRGLAINRSNTYLYVTGDNEYDLLIISLENKKLIGKSLSKIKTRKI